MSRSAALYCPEDEREHANALRIPDWIGKPRTQAEVPLLESQEEIINFVGVLAIHMVEQMVAMGTRRWICRMRIPFASRSLMTFFGEIASIPFPAPISSLVVSGNSRNAALLVFSNSRRIVQIYSEIYDCPCTDPDECSHCQQRHDEIKSLTGDEMIPDQEEEENPITQ